MTKQVLWMIVGSILPLILIFLAPIIGIEGNIALFTFIIILFVIHLLLPIKDKYQLHNLSQKKLEEESEQLLKKDKKPVNKSAAH